MSYLDCHKHGTFKGTPHSHRNKSCEKKKYDQINLWIWDAFNDYIFLSDMNKNLFNFFLNVVLLIGVLIFILVIVYAYLNTNSYSIVQTKIYFIVAFMGIIVCVTSMFLPIIFKLNVVLTLTLFLFVIYIAEFIIHYSPRTNKKLVKVYREKKKNIEFDERSTSEIIIDEKKRGITVYHIIQPIYHVDTNGLKTLDQATLFPLGGISKSKIAFCNDNGKSILFDSDEYGFNNPKGLYSGKILIEIVLVGGSFVQGSCVESQDNIAGVLTSHNKNVINLGFGGNRPLIVLATIREYASVIKPKKVFWFYYEGNDLGGLKHEKQSSFLVKYLNPDFTQNLIAKQDIIDSLLIPMSNKVLIQQQKKARPSTFLSRELFYNLKQRIKLVSIRRKLNINIMLKQIPFYKKILQIALRHANSWGGRLYFVYLPSGARYSKKEDPLLYSYRGVMLEMVHSLNIPIIDIHEAFKKSTDDPLSFFPFRSSNAHYTEEGYKVIAEAILKEIE